MIPRVRSAISVDNALPAHPAPDATNTFSVTVGSLGAYIHTVSASTSLVQIRVSADTLMLVDGSPDITTTGFPLTAGGYFSYAVRPGSQIAFQAVTDPSTVNILEG